MSDYLRSLSGRSWRMFVTVVKAMLPVMVAVEIARRLGWIELLGLWSEPFTALVNLPPEAGLVWISTIFIGMYGGIAVLLSVSSFIDLTAGQLSALAAMMVIAHAIPVEQAIVRSAGASFWATAGIRLGASLLYGAAVAWFSRLTGVLSEPVSLEWLHGSGMAEGPADPTVLEWVQSTAISLVLILAIIFALALLLDFLEYVGITKRITALLMPLLRFSGLDARVAPVTTVGVLLGLTFGGALIIEAAKTQQLDARARFLALTWLSLSHSLIEDTLLMAALGASVWVVLGGRVVLTLVIVALLARFTFRGAPAPVAT